MADFMNDYYKFLMQNQPTGAQTLASTIPYIGYANNLNKYIQPAANMAAGLTDTDSPAYQKLYGQFKEQGQQNLAESIAELSRQNRKLALMGRAPLLDTSRGGETTFRNLNQGYQDVQNQASNQAFTQLGQGYQAQQQLGKQRQENALSKAGVKGGISGALMKLFGL